MVKNWHHIDNCYPVNGPNKATNERNHKIRILLKFFLHYESSGAVGTNPDDPYNHNGRMKFIRFLNHRRSQIGNPTLQGDMRFKSTLKGFLSKFVKTDKSGTVIGVKATAHSEHFHQGVQAHCGNIPLTPLEHMTVCFRTLPCHPVDLITSYRYNLWYRVHRGKKLAYTGKNWEGIYKLRHQRIFYEVKEFHHKIAPVTNGTNNYDHIRFLHGAISIVHDP